MGCFHLVINFSLISFLVLKFSKMVSILSLFYIPKNDVVSILLLCHLIIIKIIFK
jgi:hypothetical protein